MCPHPYDLNNLFFLQHLIDQSVLNIDSTGIGSGEIANEYFIGWGFLKGIFTKDFDEFLCFGF